MLKNYSKVLIVVAIIFSMVAGTIGILGEANGFVEAEGGNRVNIQVDESRTGITTYINTRRDNGGTVNTEIFSFIH